MNDVASTMGRRRFRDPRRERIAEVVRRYDYQPKAVTSQSTFADTGYHHNE
jgi:hypothetical protein